MSKQEPIARIDNLQFFYENGVNIINNASLELYSGTIMGLIGPNGAGKTTLANLISGRLTPAFGEISFPKKEFDGQTHSPVAVVEQHLSLYEHLSVAVNICIQDFKAKELSIVTEKQIEAKAQAILQNIGIILPVSALVSSLSFSQKQLVEISRAIYQRCPILILDEPTSALDMTSKKALFQVLKKQAQEGRCILLVTHDVSDLVGLTNDVITIEEGRIKAVDRNIFDFHPRGSFPPVPQNRIPQDLRCYVELTNSKKTLSFGVNAGEVSIWHIDDALDRNLIGQSLLAMSSRPARIEMFDRVIMAERTQLQEQGVRILLCDRKAFSIFPQLSILQLYCLLTNTRLPIYQRKHVIRNIVDRLVEAGIVFSSIFNACSTLSGGNQQKLLWECLKKSQFKFLILEEPLLGLDSSSQQRILQDFASLAIKGIGILILTCYGHLYKGHNIIVLNDWAESH